MRVNVYNEEFPSHIALTEPRLDVNTRTYYGVRFYLREPLAGDVGVNGTNRAEALTFWLRETSNNTEVSDAERFVTLLLRAVKLLEDKQREQK